jgi:hypothetical protein
MLRGPRQARSGVAAIAADLDLDQGPDGGGHAISHRRRDREVSMTATLYLGLVLAVFCGFGATLAWLDYSGRAPSPPLPGPGE